MSAPLRPFRPSTAVATRLPLPTNQETLTGIAYMAAAVFLFSGMNALIKWATAAYPVVEVVFFRNVFAIPPMLFLAWSHGDWKELAIRRPSLHLLRGVFGLLSMGLMFLSLGWLPLADAVAMSFAAPLFLTALSVPLLGERVGVYRWSAVVVGFIGVLLITRPGAGMLHWGALVALGAALSSAVVMVLMRKLGRSDHPVSVCLWFAVIGTVAAGAVLPWQWQTPDLLGMAVMVLIGVIGGFAQYYMTQAFRLADATVVAPFNYTAILWAFALGFLIWGEIPDLAVLAGAAIVVASGLFIVYREAFRRVAVVSGVTGRINTV